MRVIVLDMAYKFIESFEGKYKEGKLVYKTGQTTLGFGFLKFSFGGTEEELEFDYEKTIDMGKERYALYKWNGKDYIQISFKDTFSNSPMVDYKNSWTMAKMIEETILKPPIENTFLKYSLPLAALAIIISAVVFMYVAQNSVQKIQQIVSQTPIVNISQQNAKILNYLVSKYNNSQSRDQALTNVLSNFSIYLQNHK